MMTKSVVFVLPLIEYMSNRISELSQLCFTESPFFLESGLCSIKLTLFSVALKRIVVKSRLELEQQLQFDGNLLAPAEPDR